jgi:hypothetical protein
VGQHTYAATPQRDVVTLHWAVVTPQRDVATLYCGVASAQPNVVISQQDVVSKHRIVVTLQRIVVTLYWRCSDAAVGCCHVTIPRLSSISTYGKHLNAGRLENPIASFV